jgi:hypothetical protein
MKQVTIIAFYTDTVTTFNGNAFVGKYPLLHTRG